MQRICAQCSVFSIITPLSPIQVWVRTGAENKNASGVLHVYLENDGAAFINPTQIAANPSLRASFLMMRLMQEDNNTSLYFSRPCYGFAANQMPTTCNAHYWTDARYSAEVVATLLHALDEAKKHLNKPAEKIILIGHSGGGSLALLMAQQRNDVQAVITLAGNLDTDAWVQLHHYSPLSLSLNPFAQPLLPAAIKRWYFAGAEDNNIPFSSIKPSCKRDPSAHCQVLVGVSHEQGWLAHWPKILAQINNN